MCDKKLMDFRSENKGNKRSKKIVESNHFFESEDESLSLKKKKIAKGSPKNTKASPSVVSEWLFDSESDDEVTPAKKKEAPSSFFTRRVPGGVTRRTAQLDGDLLAELRLYNVEEKAAEKKRIWTDMERSKAENEQRRKEQAAREDMDDRLIKVLLQSRARVERKRKQTEKDLKEEQLRILENISKKLESGDAQRDARDLAILNKAVAEKEAIAEARRQAEARKQERFKQDRIEVRNKFLRDEAQRLHEFNTVRQWEIMNRFKNAEMFEQFQEKLRQEKERKVKEYREDILKLWKERLDREARERAETRYFYGELAERKLRDADNKLLTHAAALLQEARELRRPDHALQRAVDRYCKLYRLYPMPDLPTSMQEHFKRYAPWDGSKPDPWYKEPPKPAPAVGPDASTTELPKVEAPKPAKPETPKQATGKRDGLQLSEPSKSAEKPKEQVEEDYKRIGRANGMQRRLQQDLHLPPISVVPCVSPACRCDLKQ